MVAILAEQRPTVKRLKDAWAGLHARSCPDVYNFHLHTVYSDGRLEPDEVIQQAVATGLQGLAITDHHSVRGYERAYRYLMELNSPSKPVLWSGVEISCELLGLEVHILGYGFDPTHDLMAPYLQGITPLGDDYPAAVVIPAIQSAGGLAVLAHPERYKKPAQELVPAASALGVDGVEAYYAYHNPNPWRPSPEKTATVLHLSRVYGLWVTCGTDTHGRNIRCRM
ncbi:PHP domain-containing protein [Gloeomargarita lithophora Alchichica-D10]|uniref:PHP domain-containing protein n=2 Tax=Gloeomargarita TaxID=1188227 RepID=A0A1J0AER3_9CYAN|nr:PHP domain-containing protein [Gloeomargarita lithophora Alchichica-D10]